MKKTERGQAYAFISRYYDHRSEFWRSYMPNKDSIGHDMHIFHGKVFYSNIKGKWMSQGATISNKIKL